MRTSVTRTSLLTALGSAVIAASTLAAVGSITTGDDAEAATAPNSAATTSATTIVVDAADTLRPISRDLFGFNHRFNVNGMYTYDPSTDDVYPAFKSAVAESGTTVLRYPGGTTANAFHWKRAIGPQGSRGCQIAAAWGGYTDDSAFGVDEHMALAEDVGASANIVVNWDTGTPQEAADWVEYMNVPVGENPNGGTAWAQVRADNGHPEPYGITWWEIGNEVGGPQTWLGTLPAGERSQAYASGGSGTYSGERVGSECNFSSPASLSDGTGSQEFTIRRPPITPDSQTIYVAGTAWQEVADLSTAGPTDQVYEIDDTAGRITFGDGTHGAIPATDARVTVDYVSGPHDGYVDFYQAMKAVDPDIEVCWVNHGSVDYNVLDGEPLDCVVEHPYTFKRPNTDMNAIDTHDWVVTRADTRAAEISNHQQALHQKEPNADTVLTEYGVFFGGTDPGPTEGYLRSMEQGLYMASLLTGAIDAGVPLAQKHPLVNWDPSNPPPGAPNGVPSMNQSPFGFYPTFVPQAAAHVTNLFTNMIGDEQVASAVHNGPVRTNATVGARYDALQAVASTDDQGRLTLIVTNRDPEQAVSAAVLPEHFPYQASANMWTVTGDSFTSYNTPANPDAVSVDKRTQDVGQGGFDHTFPAHSVTAIQLTPAGAAADTVTVTTGEPLDVQRGGQASTTIDITNTGDAATAGQLAVNLPAGWTADISPNSYTLNAGQSMQATLTVGVPGNAQAAEGQVVVSAQAPDEIAGTGVLDVTVSGLPETEWTPLQTDTFDDDPAGQAPPAWTTSGPADAITVQPSADTGNVLDVRRSASGTDVISGTRTFDAAAGDVRLSYRMRADQTTQGVAMQLIDAAGDPVLRFNAGSGGVFKYSDGSSVKSTTASYVSGTWYDVDLVFHADTGRYEAYVDGARVAEAARWPGSGAPAAVNILIGSGNPNVASYAFDDVTVLVPAAEPVFSDTFDDDPTGQPPAGYTGNTQALTVEPAAGHGQVLMMRRDQAGSARLDAFRAFDPVQGDLSLSYQERADQEITGGFGTSLLDGDGNRVLGVTMHVGDEFWYTDGGTWKSTSVPYTTGEWYDINVVLDASAGRYELEIDGVVAAEGVVTPGSGDPGSVRFTIGENQSGVSSFALDNVSVLGPPAVP